MTITPVASWTDSDTLAAVTAGIGEAFAARTRDAQRYGASYSGLWEAASRHAAGGKLMRPWLVCASYDALSGGAERRPAVVTLAVAVELLHFAFVLHDDVIDEDVVRRGTENLIGDLASSREVVDPTLPTGSATHWGTTGAILMGDALLSLVHRDFARAVVSDGESPALLDLLDRAIDESIAGEWQDVALAHRVTRASLPVILDMAANKTATYSVELPLLVGAILAGASEPTREALSRIGRSIGLAFQLHDDLVTAFGDPDSHGKDPLSDLREGKDTPLMAYARLTSAWSQIAPHWCDPHVTLEDWERVRGVLADSGSRSFVEGLIEECLTAVLEESDAADIPPAMRRIINDVCRRIAEARP